MYADQIPVWRSVLGGALIGAGAFALLLFNGRIAGISGLAERTLHGDLGAHRWRLAFLAGLVAPAVWLGPGPVDFAGAGWLYAVAGGFVGYGTRIGSGCTSGHGVCGLANASPRSLIATATFMITAVVTVFLVRHAGVL